MNLKNFAWKISENKQAKWNLARRFLIIFHLLQSFLYEEAKFDQRTSSYRKLCETRKIMRKQCARFHFFCLIRWKRRFHDADLNEVYFFYMHWVYVQKVKLCLNKQRRLGPKSHPCENWSHLSRDWSRSRLRFKIQSVIIAIEHLTMVDIFLSLLLFKIFFHILFA